MSARRPTLDELRTPIGNGIACPECGCRDLVAYKTLQRSQSTTRYRRCRNCDHAVTTRQSLEEIVRDVDTRSI